MITEKKAKEICKLVFDRQKKINENNKLIREQSYLYTSEYIKADDENIALRSEISVIFNTVKALEPNTYIFTVWNKETNDELGLEINGRRYYF